MALSLARLLEDAEKDVITQGCHVFQISAGQHDGGCGGPCYATL